MIIQSMLYTIGNKPIFPSSFNYKEYYYYLEFEENNKVYVAGAGRYKALHNEKVHGGTVY